MNEQEQRAAVIAEAQSWVGTPFHENACVKGVGVDCGRFLCAVYGACGISVPDLSDLAMFPHGWFLHKNEDRYFSIITRFARPVATPYVGDIVMLKIGRGWAHSGIVVQYPKIIHAFSPAVQSVNVNQLARMGRDRLFLSPWAPVNV